MSSKNSDEAYELEGKGYCAQCHLFADGRVEIEAGAWVRSGKQYVVTKEATALREPLQTKGVLVAQRGKTVLTEATVCADTADAQLLIMGSFCEDPADDDGDDGTMVMVGDGYRAEGASDDSDAVDVFKGSIFSAATSASCPEPARRFREQLIKTGVLRTTADGLILTKDVRFSSFTAAAQAVSGQRLNGWRAWHFKFDGRGLTD